MIYTLYLIPAMGMMIIPLIKEEKVKDVSLMITIGSLIFTVYLSLLVDSSKSFQFITSIFNVTVGVDGISMAYVLLTAALMPITVLVSNIQQEIKKYYFSLISIELLLFGVFTIQDILGFYVAYEAILIPMIIIIGVYGARKEKITAAYYFFFYTLVGSILMLIGIIYIYNTVGSTDYFVILSSEQFSMNVQILLFLAFFASFSVKIPQFPFHI